MRDHIVAPFQKQQAKMPVQDRTAEPLAIPFMILILNHAVMVLTVEQSQILLAKTVAVLDHIVAQSVIP